MLEPDTKYQNFVFQGALFEKEKNQWKKSVPLLQLALNKIKILISIAIEQRRTQTLTEYIGILDTCRTLEIQCKS